MGWYQVTKRINGRYYLYLQMTYREGGRVKTKNKYLGPATQTRGSFGSGPDNIPRAREYPKVEKPSGGLKVDKIRRLKPRTRDFINREAAKRRFEKEARADYEELKEARKAGAPHSDLSEQNRLNRRAYKNIFRHNLKLAKRR